MTHLASYELGVKVHMHSSMVQYAMYVHVHDAKALMHGSRECMHGATACMYYAKACILGYGSKEQTYGPCMVPHHACKAQ